jgi:hypothetical protein
VKETDVGRKLTKRTLLKTGDLVVFYSKRLGHSMVGEVVSERRVPTPVGLRRLLYLSCGDGIEHFGTRGDFMGMEAVVITVSELVQLTNHLAPIAKLGARTRLRELKLRG